VVQWATGSVGQYAIQAIAARADLELVGCYVTDPDKVGRDAGELSGIDPLGVVATNELEAVLSSGADCVHYAPLHTDHDDVCRLLKSGLNVVTPTFYVHPSALAPELVGRLERACHSGKSTLHGTGIHPGFSGDRLALTLAGLCRSVSQVIVEEVADLSPHPSTAMMFEGLGFGAPPEQVLGDPPAVLRTMDEFFGQSQRLIVGAFGLQAEGFETAHEVAVAAERMEVRSGTIESGRVAAQKFEWRTLVGGRPFVIYRGFWKMGDALDPAWEFSALKYSVIVEGDPAIRCGFEPGATFTGEPDPDFDPGAAGRLWTTMLGVNAIPFVCAAPPGFLGPADLPAGQVLPPVVFG
jgi:hypothetical protein